MPKPKELPKAAPVTLQRYFFPTIGNGISIEAATLEEAEAKAKAIPSVS